MIDIQRLLRVPFVDSEGGFDISPDGRYLAFAWNITGRWEIYELALNTSVEPRLVSAGPGGKFAPRYSPDGSHLAYAVDFDGSENFHLFLQACHPEGSQGAQTSQPIDLTSKADFAIKPNFCWSPDGKQIAFLADQSGCFDTYMMPASGGPARLLFANGFPASLVTWSPDGRSLAVMCEATGQDHAVYVIPLDESEPFSIAEKHVQVNAWYPAWSPDSTRLAFHSDVRDGFHQIGIFDLSSRQISWLTDEKRNCRTPAWSGDGTKLTYISAQGATDQVVFHPLSGGACAFMVESGVHYKPRFTPDESRVVFLFNNPRHPPDLWTLIPDSGEFIRLTNSFRRSAFPGTGRRGSRSRSITAEAVITLTPNFVMPEEVNYPSKDGTPIPALLFKSENADETTPAAIVIHGGPSWHFQMEWYPFIIHLASRGWTVLAPNYRGSTGYGREWQLSNRFNLGGIDTDDVAAGVGYLLLHEWADPQRIAVTGRSHGGYLTMSCLTRYPELWHAGSAVVPFLNWFTAHENSREDLQHWDLQNFGNPIDHKDLWYERSPFFFLDQVNAPVQLICGENDPRCPASESIQARDKLLELGKEVDFHLYLGEGHAFLKTENIVDAEARRVEFLARALE